MQLHARFSAVVLASSIVAFGAAAEDSLLKRGQHLLDRGDITAAIETFRSAAAAATGADREEAARAQFYLGLACDFARESAPNAEKKPYFDCAASAYEAALEAKPTGATMNNLAQLYTVENPERALTLLRRAIDLADGRKAFYRENLGDLLARSGRHAEAAVEYIVSSVAEPHRVARRKKAQTEILAWANGAEWRTGDCVGAARSYVGHLYAQTALDEAIDTAFYLVEGSARIAEGAGKSLLAVVAASLSKKNYARAQFKDTDVGRRLGEMTSEAVAQGAHQLVDLYADSVFEANHYRYWRDEVSRKKGIPSPLEAFTLLSRSLGYDEQSRGDTGTAERYYRLAVNMGDRNPDPGAFLDLASLYVSTRRINELERLVAMFDERLYRGKGLAYERLRHRSTPFPEGGVLQAFRRVDRVVSQLSNESHSGGF